MPVRNVVDEIMFFNIIERNQKDNKLIIFNIGASWCGPCKKYAPRYEELSDKYKHVVFYKITADKLPSEEITDFLETKCFPSFYMFHNGIAVLVESGCSQETEDKIVNFIENNS